MIPYLIHFAVNTNYLKDKASSLILEKTSVHIDPFHISLKLFPKPGIILKDFTLIPDKTINVQISRLKCDLDLQNLLHGRIAISQIFLQDPKISFSSMKSQQSESPLRFQPNELKNEFKRVFALLSEGQQILELKIENAVSPFFKRMDGTLFLSRETNDILFNATIKELELKTNDLSVNSLDQYLDIESAVFNQLTLTAKINSDFEIQGELNAQDIGIRSSNKELIFDSKAMIFFSGFRIMPINWILNLLKWITRTARYPFIFVQTRYKKNMKFNLPETISILIRRKRCLYRSLKIMNL